VFKEADTLEMPTVAIAPTTFVIGGFSRDSILPAFVNMFNQYQFTNDDFLTDVKFIATAEEFPHLHTVAERSTTLMTASNPVRNRSSGQASRSKQPEVATAVVTGDIVQFPADAIVVPVSPSLDMKGATSQAVNDASKGELLRQCSHLKGSLVEGKVVPVPCEAEWNIQAKFLYLLVRSRYTKKDILKQACTQALQTAKAHSLSSIAFPPVTTHKGKEDIAKAMHQVFTTFQQHQSQSDLTITVVIKKDDMAIHEAFIKVFLPHTKSGSLNNESRSSEV
jgi:O-acetyl-ADP-ribose deacetylase (regulator of RNase III)